jgi:hypothetical protein
MTQQVVKAVCTMPALDATTDACSFALHFEATGSNASLDLASLKTALVGFINTPAGTAIDPVSSYISEEISRATNACEWLLYDITTHLSGTPAGSPIDSIAFTLGLPLGGNPLPAGIANAFGYRADYGTDVEFGTGTRPRARDRNRFYLGPLQAACLTYDAVTHRPMWTAQFLTDVLKSLSDVSQLNDTEPDQMSLVVWSRKNASVKQAILGFVDDRPDYQRRRSDPSAAAKTTHVLGA